MSPTNSRLLQCVYDFADYIVTPPLDPLFQDTDTASYSPLFVPDGQYPTFLRLDETIPAYLSQSLEVCLVEVESSLDPAPLLEYVDKLRRIDVFDFAEAPEELGNVYETSKVAFKLFYMAKAILRFLKHHMAFDKPPRPYFSIIPDEVLKLDKVDVIHWQEDSAQRFDTYSGDLVALALSEEGKDLNRPSSETDAKSILYKIGIYMIGHDIDWGVFFGGHKALIFRKTVSPPNNQGLTRPGLVCSRQIALKEFFPLLVAMLLHPRGQELRLLPSIIIDPPANNMPLTRNIPESEDRAWVKLYATPGKEAMNHNISTLSRTKALTLSLFGTTVLFLSRVAAQQEQEQPPVIFVDAHVHAGSIGVTFRAFYSSLDLILKAVRTTSGGADALRREIEAYEALVSIQGIAVPHCFGLFESEQWLVLVLEDVGPTLDRIGGTGVLSRAQRSTIINHLEAIHRLGIVHGDIKNNNISVAGDGSIRIFDFSHSFPKDGECPGRKQCYELRDVIRDMDL